MNEVMRRRVTCLRPPLRRNRFPSRVSRGASQFGTHGSGHKQQSRTQCGDISGHRCQGVQVALSKVAVDSVPLEALHTQMPI